MGAEANQKITNRTIRRAFGAEACETIESLNERQVQMAAGLDKLEGKERVLDYRTRELRVFLTMTLKQRAKWLLFGTMPPSVGV